MNTYLRFEIDSMTVVSSSKNIKKNRNTEYKTQKRQKYTQKGWGCCPVFEKREMLINDSG